MGDGGQILGIFESRAHKTCCLVRFGRKERSQEQFTCFRLEQLCE